jgi:hypothetical protein
VATQRAAKAIDPRPLGRFEKGGSKTGLLVRIFRPLSVRALASTSTPVTLGALHLSSVQRFKLP